VRIHIEILGLPALSQAVGKREFHVDIPGETVTVRRVLDHLVGQFGASVRETLCDAKNSLNPMIQIALNGEKFISSDRLDTSSLDEDDTLTFMLLMAGGGVKPSVPD
jgi:hypothetical protein